MNCYWYHPGGFARIPADRVANHHRILGNKTQAPSAVQSGPTTRMVTLIQHDLLESPVVQERHKKNPVRGIGISEEKEEAPCVHLLEACC